MTAPEKPRDHTYLGDGLYASFDGYSIKLYAHDGIRPHDTVYLEPPVFLAFEKYVAALRALGWAPIKKD